MLFGDDLEDIQAIVRTTLASIPRRLGKLGAALAGGDLRGAELQAHAVKGAAANLGGDEPVQRIRYCQQRLPHGDL